MTVVKFLAVRGCTTRGSSDIFGRTYNGNYMGITELTREFDQFMRSDREICKSIPSYLSAKLCEELLS